MPVEVLRGRPVPIPACLHEHRASAHVEAGKGPRIDRATTFVRAHHDGVEIRERVEIERREILPLREPMERRVDVGAGVGHHVDPPDLELGTRGVVARASPRGS